MSSLESTKVFGSRSILVMKMVEVAVISSLGFFEAEEEESEIALN